MRGTELVLVSDRQRLAVGRSLPMVAAHAARAGVDWIQVREKDLAARDLFDLVREVVQAVEGTLTRVLVSGRSDIAEAAGAHGVQLPEQGLPVAHVKRVFPRLLVSASRHSLEGARRAQDDGADLLVVGPVFATPGKPVALGAAGLAEIVGALSVPVYAIGGIEPSVARRVVEAGATGLAAIRAFLVDPVEDAVHAFREAVR
ncbi:MAG: thiamine phosphate synthase [Vicinamibacteria bacterium]